MCRTTGTAGDGITCGDGTATSSDDGITSGGGSTVRLTLLFLFFQHSHFFS